MTILTRLRPSLFSISALLATAFLLATSAFAQDKRYTDNKADQALRSEARVDPSTLGMSLEIPLEGAPGRAGTNLSSGLRYSSKQWRINYSMGWQGQLGYKVWTRPKFSDNSMAGWTSSLDVPRIEYTGQNQVFDNTGTPVSDDPSFPPSQYCYILRIHLHLPDGSSHELRKSDTPQCFASAGAPAFTGTFDSTDSAGMRFDADSGVLYLADGGRYIFGAMQSAYRYNNELVSGRWATQYLDRNGNTLNYSFSSVTDTMGRSHANPLANDPVAGNQIFNVLGVGGSTLSYTLVWANLANALSNADSLNYTSNSKCVAPNNYQAVSPGLFTTDISTRVCAANAVFNPVVLAEVQLPNGQKYQLKYNVFGEIDKIIYPTGGYERFLYGYIAPLDPDTVYPYSQANRGVLERWVSPSGNVSEESTNHWVYTAGGISPYKTTVTAPNGTRTEQFLGTGGGSYFGFENPLTGMAYEARTYNSTYQMLRRTLTEWSTVTPPGSAQQRNPLVTKSINLILDTGGNALAVAGTTQYDADLNPISSSAYDYASVDPTTAQTGAIGSIPMGTLMRTQETTYLVNDTSISSTVRQTYRDRQLLGLPSSSRVKNAGGSIVAQSEIKYDEAAYPLLTYGAVTGWTDPATTVRGLPTTSRSWLNTTGGWLESHAQYDQCGSARNSWDAKGNQSQVEYSSANAYAYPTLTRTPIPDPTGQRGSATALVSTSVYDFTTGRVTSTTDANSQTTTIAYGDSLNRPTLVMRPTGGGSTIYEYNDAPGSLYAKTRTALDAGRYIETYQYFDGLGRGNRSLLNESGTYATTDTQYDNMGRVWRSSNPYRITNLTDGVNPSGLWTTSAYDALGRVLTVTTPDGAMLTSAYSGQEVTVTDQAGKKRKSVTDGLGRLKEVYEDPTGPLNYLTSYSYDVLDNLTTVSQGVQTRTFIYDSLKRLTSATNPESGAVTYTYDNNGNLTTKLDVPRNITTTLVYDALNRIITKGYTNDGGVTPPVNYYYDNAAMPSGAPSFDRGSATGRLVAVAYGSGSSAGTYRGYDTMGRVVLQHQQTDSVNYKVDATYNLASGLASETYPSVPGAGDRRTVTYTPDAAGRLASLGSNATTYAAAASLSGILYKPHGGLETETLGNSLIHQQVYNSRLQATAIKLGTSGNPTSVLNLTYDYGTTDNNGNVKSHANTIGTLAITDAFTYDPLNRLLATTETSTAGGGWTETNHYDQYGNRSIDLGGGNYSLSFTAANNRITSKTYDAVGNLTVDGTAIYGYDAENRMISVNSTTGYSYDGEGRRVRKLIGENTRFIYGIRGELIAEFNGASGSLSKEYVTGGGTMAVIDPSAGTRYTTTDHLGSPRVVTNSSGTMVSRHDYLPFGEELGAGTSGRTTVLGYGNTDGVRDKFTGYERDGETGLDFAQARYYSSVQGRFTSSDPLMASGMTVNPKTWNRYAYALNNPLRYTDPTGLRACTDASCSGNEDDETKSQGELDYEQRLQKTFDAIAAQSKPKPQNTLVEDNPAMIESLLNNSGSSISVLFFGSFPFGAGQLPNGDSTVKTKDSEFFGREHGLGFSVYGSVPDGDSVAPDSNSGGWRMEQYVWNYEKINGRVRANDSRSTKEVLSGAPHEVTGNTFRWYDHPGIGTNFISSYERRTNFVVKVIKGGRQSEVKFHFIQTFNNGKWSVRWGNGNY